MSLRLKFYLMSTLKGLQQLSNMSSFLPPFYFHVGFSPKTSTVMSPCLHLPPHDLLTTFIRPLCDHTSDLQSNWTYLCCSLESLKFLFLGKCMLDGCFIKRTHLPKIFVLVLVKNFIKIRYCFKISLIDLELKYSEIILCNQLQVRLLVVHSIQEA